MPTIEVTPEIVIDQSELAFPFARAGGPGGQNVNKVATAVQLRFDVTHSPSLDDAVKRRLKRLAGTRPTKDGVLVNFARTHRSQERNRQDARAITSVDRGGGGKAGISRKNPSGPRRPRTPHRNQG
jgi:ribosome-associated protein